MSESGSASDAAMLVRVTLPWVGSYRGVVTALAVKVAEYLGDTKPEADDLALVIDRVGATVAAHDHAAEERHHQKAHPEAAVRDVTFEFRQRDGELLIEARCEGRSSEARRPLPA